MIQSGIYPPKIKENKEKNTVSYTEIQACGDAKVQDNLEKDCLVSVEIKKEAGIRQRIKDSDVQICISS